MYYNEPQMPIYMYAMRLENSDNMLVQIKNINVYANFMERHIMR